MKKMLCILLVLLQLSVCCGALAEIWYCPKCGRMCTENFCPFDATPKPSDLGSSTGSSYSGLKAGDIITMGTWEQDNNSRNGSEPVEWMVLAVENNRVLLLTRYGIELHLIHPYSANVTWSTCKMRSWLNSTLLHSMFSSAEQARIEYTLVSNGRSTGYPFSQQYNPQYGPDTWDWIFLLSWQETQRYFPNEASRRCKATAYCAARGAKVMSNGYCWWWLRSPGYECNMALAINSEGKRVPGDQHVHNNNKNTGLVRPAMWINLSN